VEPCDGAPPLRQAFSLMMNSSSSFVEFDLALLDLIEQVFKRHQLGEAGRRHQLIAILLEQHAVAVGVEQKCGGNAGLKTFGLFGVGCGRCERRGDNDDAGQSGSEHACRH